MPTFDIPAPTEIAELSPRTSKQRFIERVLLVEAQLREIMPPTHEWYFRMVFTERRDRSRRAVKPALRLLGYDCAMSQSRNHRAKWRNIVKAWRDPALTKMSRERRWKVAGL